MSAKIVLKDKFIIISALLILSSCKSILIFKGDYDQIHQTTVISGNEGKKIFAGFDEFSGSENLNNSIVCKSKYSFSFGPVSKDRLDYGGFAVITKDDNNMFGVEFFWFSHNGTLRKGVSTKTSKNRLTVNWLTDNSFVITEKKNKSTNLVIKLRKDDGDPQFSETNY